MSADFSRRAVADRCRWRVFCVGDDERLSPIFADYNSTSIRFPFDQCRIKALRGPAGSTVTWGTSLSLLHFPLPPLPQPSPSPAAKRPPNPARGSGERCKLPQRCLGAEHQPKSNLVDFSLKIRHLLATILMIFLRVLPKNFSVAHYSGAQELGAPVHWTAWIPGSYATAFDGKSITLSTTRRPILRTQVCPLKILTDSLQRSDAVGQVTWGKDICGLWKVGCWFLGGDHLTGALHVLLQRQLSPPLPSSLAAI